MVLYRALSHLNLPMGCRGTSSSIDGGKEPSDCLQCQPGKYCSSSMGTGLCAEGYYCKGGSTTPTPTGGAGGDICPAGHFCPEGSYVAQVRNLDDSESLQFAATSRHLVSCYAECVSGVQPSSALQVPTVRKGKESALLVRSVGNAQRLGYKLQKLPAQQVMHVSKGQYSLCPVHWARLQLAKAAPHASFALVSKCVGEVPEGCSKLELYLIRESSGAHNITRNNSLWLPSGGFVCDEAALARPSSICPSGFVCARGARTDLLPLQVFGEDIDDYGLCPVGHFCPPGSATPTPCARGTFQVRAFPQFCDCMPCNLRIPNSALWTPLPCFDYCFYSGCSWGSKLQAM